MTTTPENEVNSTSGKEYVLTDQDVIVTKTNLKGIITYVNDDLQRITGYSEQELIGISHNIFRHPDMPAEAFSNLWRTILSEYTWRGIVKNKTKDGGFYWVHADVTPLYENKTVVGFMSVRVKPTIEEVQKAEIAYAQMNEGTFTGKFIYGDIVEHNVLDDAQRKFDDIKISTKFILQISLSVMAIILLTALDYVELNRLNKTHQESIAQIQSYFHEVNLQKGAQLNSLEEKMKIYEPAKSLESKNNKDDLMLDKYFSEIKTFSNQALRDVQNKKVFVVCSLLLALILLYRFIIRSIVSPLKEAQGGLRELSNGVYRFPIQYRSKNELGKMMEALRTTSVRLGFDVANEKKISAEIIKAHEKNHSLNAQINQLQRIESVGRMTAGIAHHFNNILGAIIGFNQMNIYAGEDCHDESLKQEILENSQQIQIASGRAAELVKQMMSYSNQNSEKLYVLDFKPTADVIDDALALMRPALSSTFTVHTEIDRDLEVEIASNNLHQILINLIINARDAMDGRGVIAITLKKIKIDKLVCNACLHKLKGEFIELSVSDNGAGIEKRIMTHIFDPFFTTKLVGEGTGLGLSTVSGMVHEVYGHILVESQSTGSTQGATFRLLFPLK
jgi:PAS domain S-box-containing protein